MEDKAGVHSFLFHCLFPLREVYGCKYPGTNDQPLLCMCHRKSSTRAAENMPCTILTPLACPRTSRNHAGSLRVQGKVTQGCGLQDTRAHYLVIPSSMQALVEAGVGQWRLWSTAICQQGRLMAAGTIQGLTGYKLFSHYLFNLHSLSGIYYYYNQ